MVIKIKPEPADDKDQIDATGDKYKTINNW